MVQPGDDREGDEKEEEIVYCPHRRHQPAGVHRCGARHHLPVTSVLLINVLSLPMYTSLRVDDGDDAEAEW